MFARQTRNIRYFSNEYKNAIQAVNMRNCADRKLQKYAIVHIRT